MLAFFEAASVLHVLLGFVSLVAFWLPVFARKGGRNHRRIGMVFMAAMVGTSLSAFVLAGLSLSAPLVFHPARSEQTSRLVAMFLGYLAFVTLVIVHNATAAVWHKRDLATLSQPWRRYLNHGATAASALSLGFGIWASAPVLAAMSPVGFAVSAGWSRFLREAPTDPKAWLREHIGATLSGGIAVHTAFIAGGGTKFLPEFVASLGVFGWVLPTLIGVPAITIWSRRVAPASA